MLAASGLSGFMRPYRAYLETVSATTFEAFAAAIYLDAGERHCLLFFATHWCAYIRVEVPLMERR